MNIIYLKYAVAVARAGSLNKAAEELYVAQPNLSRAIKELEKELGVVLFERTSKGISLTSDGERLVSYGKKILKEIDDVEAEFREKKGKKTLFSASVIRSEYISRAFAEFCSTLSDDERSEAILTETDNRSVVTNVMEKDSRIGVVGYPSCADKQMKEAFEAKRLSHELVAEYELRVLSSAGGELAKETDLKEEKLSKYTRVAFLNDFALPFAAVEADKKVREADKTIYVSDFATMLNLLTAIKNSYAYTPPVTEETLERYNLSLITVGGEKRKFRDVLIYPADYVLSKADKDFITALCTEKRNVVK